jgi:hypothetical protein
MVNYGMISVSDEAVSILREGGSRCESFLETISQHQEAVNAFCNNGFRLTEIDVGTERSFEEPFYSFSDGFGRYNIDGIKDSL